jgi:hypothetical protein
MRSTRSITCGARSTSPRTGPRSTMAARCCRLRRRDPADRRVRDLLRHGGGAPVRDDAGLLRQRASRSPARATSCAACSCCRARASACRSPSSRTRRRMPRRSIKLAGGAPVVIKLLEGTQGIGVVLGETPKGGRVDHPGVRRRQHQHPRPGIYRGSAGRGHSLHRHRRQGGRIDAAARAGGDFRSNLHRGGSAKAIKITPQERATAIGAAKAMGLNVCGVDMLRSNHGPVVMEVNSSPGLEGSSRRRGRRGRQDHRVHRKEC